jgi:four helix bundle protein
LHKYRDLKVWQRAMVFTITIYHESQAWPDSEKFGLISQIRRAATSIPLNIAEEAGNSSNKDSAAFLRSLCAPLMKS